LAQAYCVKCLKNGGEEPAERQLEEQEASDTRKLPILWNQGIPELARASSLDASTRARGQLVNFFN